MPDLTYDAESVRIDTDEDGFALEISTVENGLVRIRINGCSLELVHEVERVLVPYWREGGYKVSEA
ncbi:MAG: hypothetical protein KatS3mg015_2484 [Fimbriimonadales bacterium]|nr:MAG: hypothetical protein KatS3mg015_2484 [Fimbriimonadales bacterium]